VLPEGNAKHFYSANQQPISYTSKVYANLLIYANFFIYRFVPQSRAVDFDLVKSTAKHIIYKTFNHFIKYKYRLINNS
jgi:hypothetical protein